MSAVPALLSQVFRGYTRAHTRFRPVSSKIGADIGKVKGNYVTVRGSLDESAWESHFRGDLGVGVIPLCDDGTTVYWGAIDVDILKLDHVSFEKRIRDSGLPLVVARSKSGGAHCFLFLREAETAAKVADRLSKWAAALGLDSAEIFPKQTRREDDSDSGSALNMPYYGGDGEDAPRRAIRYGEWLSLEEFITLAKNLATTLDAAPLFQEIEVSTSFVDGPPCLQRIEKNGGFASGQRNIGIFNASIYLIKAGRYDPEDETEIQSINEAICSPPLDGQEVSRTYQSASSKRYEFTCKVSPLATYCNRHLCLSRRYGVGETTDGRKPRGSKSPQSGGDPGGGGGDEEDGSGFAPWPEVTEAVLHKAETIGRERWFLTIYGICHKFKTSEIMSQTEFRTAICGLCGVLIRRIPDKRFERYKAEQIFKKLNTVTPSEIESDYARFEFYLRRFLNQRTCATSPDGLRIGQCYAEGGMLWFHHEGLVSYLSTTCSDLARSRDDLFSFLRKSGAITRDFYIGQMALKVWGMPDAQPRETPNPPVFTQGEVNF